MTTAAAPSPTPAAPSRPAPGSATRAGEAARPSLSSELDTLSLQQALVDFEIANARVLDLTARLVALHEDNVRLARELEAVSSAYAADTALWERMRTSRAFKIAERIWALRGALKV
jgi:hypothetical protein